MTSGPRTSDAYVMISSPLILLSVQRFFRKQTTIFGVHESEWGFAMFPTGNAEPQSFLARARRVPWACPLLCDGLPLYWGQLWHHAWNFTKLHFACPSENDTNQTASRPHTIVEQVDNLLSTQIQKCEPPISHIQTQHQQNRKGQRQSWQSRPQVQGKCLNPMSHSTTRSQLPFQRVLLSRWSHPITVNRVMVHAFTLRLLWSVIRVLIVLIDVAMKIAKPVWIRFIRPNPPAVLRFSDAPMMKRIILCVRFVGITTPTQRGYSWAIPFTTQRSTLQSTQVDRLAFLRNRVAW